MVEATEVARARARAVGSVVVRAVVEGWEKVAVGRIGLAAMDLGFLLVDTLEGETEVVAGAAIVRERAVAREARAEMVETVG